MVVIFQVTVVSQQELMTYTLGDYIQGQKTFKIVDESSNEQTEFYKLVAYSKDGQYLKAIINCPVDITFKEIEENN